MAFTYKILGQSSPAATTYTKLYTAPSATSSIVSTLVVANRASTAVSFRIAICPSSQTAATPSNQNVILMDAVQDANGSTFLTIGATLATGDYITVWSSSADSSFSAFGTEIT